MLNKRDCSGSLLQIRYHPVPRLHAFIPRALGCLVLKDGSCRVCLLQLFSDRVKEQLRSDSKRNSEEEQSSLLALANRRLPLRASGSPRILFRVSRGIFSKASLVGARSVYCPSLSSKLLRSEAATAACREMRVKHIQPECKGQQLCPGSH